MRRIWFIDDDKFNVIIASKIFKDLGIFDEVYAEQQSSKAAMVIDKLSIDTIPRIIFLDQNMPILKGSHLLEKMIEKGLDLSKTKCYVMINSEIPPEFKNKNLSIWVTEYITRPLKKDKIKAIVDAYL